MRVLALILLLAADSAFSGEFVVFHSGTTMHVDRHEIDGAKVRLFNGEGSIELASSEVVRFEEEQAGPQPASSVAVPQRPAAPPEADRPRSPVELADAAADRYGLDRKLVRLVMAAESGFQPQAISPKGAIGLMQLMPSTAQSLGVDPHDPAQNVDAGARQLRALVIKYGGGLRHVLAAYNAGEAAVDKYRGIPPFPETIEYIMRIEREYLKSGN